MLNKILLPAVTAVLVALLLPSEVDAYGAAHVGYTHVGPSGVYHTGTNAAAGPRGVAANTHTTAYGAGGGAYHSTAGVAAGGYHVAPTYAGGAHYGYVR
jgi:hypothetical protein